MDLELDSILDEEIEQQNCVYWTSQGATSLLTILFSGSTTSYNFTIPTNLSKPVTESSLRQHVNHAVRTTFSNPSLWKARYIPGSEELVNVPMNGNVYFFNHIKATLKDRLNTTNAFRCNDGRLRSLCKVRRLPSKLRDRNDRPLISPETVSLGYLPPDISRDPYLRFAVRLLEVPNLSIEDFLRGLSYTLSTKANISADWHEDVCKALLGLNLSIDCLSELELIPLEDGSWKSQIQMQKTLVFHFPSVPNGLWTDDQTIRYDVVPSSARYALFLKIGATELNSELIAQKLLATHCCSSVSDDEALEDALFLFQYRNEIQIELSELWLFSAAGEPKRPSELCVGTTREVSARIHPSNLLHSKFIAPWHHPQPGLLPSWRAWLKGTLEVNYVDHMDDESARNASAKPIQKPKDAILTSEVVTTSRTTVYTSTAANICTTDDDCDSTTIAQPFSELSLDDRIDDHVASYGLRTRTEHDSQAGESSPNEKGPALSPFHSSLASNEPPTNSNARVNSGVAAGSSGLTALLQVEKSQSQPTDIRSHAQPSFRIDLSRVREVGGDESDDPTTPTLHAKPASNHPQTKLNANAKTIATNGGLDEAPLLKLRNKLNHPQRLDVTTHSVPPIITVLPRLPPEVFAAASASTSIAEDSTPVELSSTNQSGRSGERLIYQMLRNELGGLGFGRSNWVSSYNKHREDIDSNQNWETGVSFDKNGDFEYKDTSGKLTQKWLGEALYLRYTSNFGRYPKFHIEVKSTVKSNKEKTPFKVSKYQYEKAAKMTFRGKNKLPWDVYVLIRVWKTREKQMTYQVFADPYAKIEDGVFKCESQYIVRIT